MTIESECPVWLRYIGCSKKNIKGLGQIFLRELSGFRAAGPAQNIPLGPRLVIPLGPRSVQPARFAQAGPVWFPRTKTGGAPPGFPCGSRFPPGAGPTRGPSANCNNGKNTGFAKCGSCCGCLNMARCTGCSQAGNTPCRGRFGVFQWGDVNSFSARCARNRLPHPKHFQLPLELTPV